jgi:hypothetical protein
MDQCYPGLTQVINGERGFKFGKFEFTAKLLDKGQNEVMVVKSWLL